MDVSVAEKEGGDVPGERTALSGPEKALTGITGFDEITGGGLPRGRPTLVTGAAGSGKTLFGIEFLVRGARDFGEPGVLLAFEESQSDLATNVASLGFDLDQLEKDGLLAIDAFRLDPAEIVETGSFDLEGLFIRLAMAVESVGAKRVFLDTIELLFSALPNEAIIRGELGRLFRWLKERDLTVVISGERGKEGDLTRFGIEEYVSDCVVTLDHRVEDQISTRRLRVAKYRGSLHGTNEYPFLITERGLVVVPITSVGLTYEASRERISTGVPRLDEMLSGGIYRGSSVMISGTAGTGKTSLGALMVDASCARGEKALFFSFEESPEQLIRNMGSIGMDLRRWIDAGLLQVKAVRPTAYGFEEHLAMLHDLITEHEPQLVVLDAVASLTLGGAQSATTSAISRDLDLLKGRGITGVMTTLTHGEREESSEVDVSSLVDTWLLLRNDESNGERNRLLFVIKSRGSAHSNQVREFVLTDDGAELLDVYVGPQGVLTGSERVEQISQERLAQASRADETERRRQELATRSAAVRAEMAALQAQLAADTAEFERFEASADAGRASGAAVRALLGRERSGDREGGPRDDGV
ncbi:circadian clock protein KaiC [Marmoricola sp. URHB0036]|uniref:circadian clock protein KaiC n=1 Tax=Marmoricola sp. URHB0036 TaxID=1298863 RepID=UPI0003FB0AEC|nr:circadian clock protein KaiC [Marmoricola sp. URHB0036]